MGVAPLFYLEVDRGVPIHFPLGGGGGIRENTGQLLQHDLLFTNILALSKIFGGVVPPCPQKTHITGGTYLH